jgi:hypothetical protein
MSTYLRLAAAVTLLFVAGCASNPPRPAFSGFEELPIPEGMKYVADRSTVIDGPTVKMARVVHRGRFEVESVGASMRKGLEAKGWRHVSTATSSEGSITQIFEKAGSTVLVMIWEGTWYTYIETVATTNILARR